MLLKTTTVNGHYHLVFVLPDGSGYTSMDKGHFHNIMATEKFNNFKVDEKQLQTEFFNTDPEDLDNDKNVATSHSIDKFKLVDVYPTNNHTHKITGINLRNEEKKKKVTDDERLREVYAMISEAMRIDGESKKDAEESAKFAKGDQYDRLTKSRLEEDEKACLTLNYTKRLLNFLDGMFRQNKMDIQTLPEEEADSFAVDILNPILRRIQHNTNFHKNETQAFNDQIKVGRGGLMVDIDTKHNPMGDISINYFHWKDFSVGPHIKSDGEDAEYMAVHPLYSINKIKAMYPDKAEEITKNWHMIENNLTLHIKPEPQDAYRNSEVREPFIFDYADSKFVNKTKKEIMLGHLYEKEYTNKKVAANPLDNEYIDVTRLQKADFNKLKNLHGFAVINSCTTRVKVTIVAGSVLLEEKYSLFDDFNLVFAYANKESDYWWGIVEDIKDSQREINKWSSKFSDLLNKADAWQTVAGRDAFDNDEDFEEYLEKASNPGYIPKFGANAKDSIVQLNNSNYAQLRDALSGVQQAVQQMSDITNIQPAVMGQTTTAESGVALAQKTRAGLLGNEYIFDNFSAMKEKIGKLMIQAIQKTWSPERILRLVEAQSSREQITVGGEALYPQLEPEQLLQFGLNSGQLQQQQAQQIAQALQNQQITPEIQTILEQLQAAYREFRRDKLKVLIENVDLTRYDVSVVENTHSPTTMLSNFMILTDLAKTRPDIPMTALLKTWPFMSTSQKDEILQSIQAQQQAQIDADKMKYGTELKKTEMAQQGKQQDQGQPITQA